MPAKAPVPRFVTLLRARIKGARVEAVRQVENNRLVEFTLQKDGVYLLLIFRLWGSSGNAFLCTPEFQILDCVFRRPQREEQSGQIFKYPPPADNPRVFTIRDYPSNLTFNQYLEESYTELEIQEKTTQLKTQLERQLQQAELRYLSKIRALEDQLARISDPERFKYYGDLIKAALHTLHGGETVLHTEDWYTPGTTLRIPLDPARSPSSNAEKWYQAFQKARDSRSYVESSLQNQKQTLNQIQYLLLALSEAQNLADLELIKHDAPKIATGTSTNHNLEDEFPGVRFQRFGFQLFIGRNSQENDQLLRRHVRGNDYWLHARDWPGSYVFIKARKDKSPPLELLLDCAHLAVWYSRGRQAGSADVYYTQVKYLRRVKDGPRGLVIPTQEKNIFVKIDEARLKLLLG
jgi:predicted ribosome quality control (RQC) complex YloA/Tae2 family protein